jgi:hypothetical protein
MGRFRPASRGYYGRFKVTRFDVSSRQGWAWRGKAGLGQARRGKEGLVNGFRVGSIPTDQLRPGGAG